MEARKSQHWPGIGRFVGICSENPEEYENLDCPRVGRMVYQAQERRVYGDEIDAFNKGPQNDYMNIEQGTIKTYTHQKYYILDDTKKPILMLRLAYDAERVFIRSVARYDGEQLIPIPAMYFSNRAQEKCDTKEFAGWGIGG